MIFKKFPVGIGRRKERVSLSGGINSAANFYREPTKTHESFAQTETETEYQDSDFIAFAALMELLPHLKFDILVVFFMNIPVRYRKWRLAEDVIAQRFRYVSCINNSTGDHSIVPSTHEDVVRYCTLKCIENFNCG